MAKVLCVLYDDPVDGYPKTYARDDLPRIDHYPGGQTTPTPQGIDFTPGSSSAVSPVSWGCVRSLSPAATASSSPRTRTGTGPSSTRSWSTPMWSSRSRSGPRI